jgi:hypothetical protein
METSKKGHERTGRDGKGQDGMEKDGIGRDRTGRGIDHEEGTKKQAKERAGE